MAAKAAGPLPLDDVSSTNYAVGPQDFYTIYNEQNPLLTAPTPINGSGVTIALLEESAITSSDVTFFRTMFGVNPATPASLTIYRGPSGSLCSTPGKLKTDGEEGEAILDIEWAGAVAPGANLLFAECKASGATAGIFVSAEKVINNNAADIMSLSYGDYEGQDSTQDVLVADLWEQAASQGQTVVVSAGDTGPATEDGNLQRNVATDGITSSSFSTTAWNVSAGGTDFQDVYNQNESDGAYGINAFWSPTNTPSFGSALSYIPEMTWNDTCASSIYNSYVEGMSADGATLCGATSTGNLYLVAGGGGPSILHARPSWQTGTVFGLPNTTDSPNRLQPDVSLFAANGLWYHDLPSYESDLSGISYAGGTSFVAPQLAGDVCPGDAEDRRERLGQPDHVLYSMAGQEYRHQQLQQEADAMGVALPVSGTTSSIAGAQIASSMTFRQATFRSIARLERRTATRFQELPTEFCRPARPWSSLRFRRIQAGTRRRVLGRSTSRTW